MTPGLHDVVKNHVDGRLGAVGLWAAAKEISLERQLSRGAMRLVVRGSKEFAEGTPDRSLRLVTSLFASGRCFIEPWSILALERLVYR